MMPELRRRLLLPAFAAMGVLGCCGAASAQVIYAQPSPLAPLFSPYDEVYGTSPSFEIHPDAYGAGPAVRVVERCQYPAGWNVTDFSRDVNGIPSGIDHTCPTVGLGGRVRTRY